MNLAEFSEELWQTVTDRREAYGRIARTVCLFLAACLALLAIVLGVETGLFVKGAGHATGVVTGNLATSAKGTDAVSYSPVFSFTAEDGKSYSVTGLATNPPQFKAGEQVTVVYRREAPGQAKISSLMQLWGLSLVLGAVAIFLAAVGCGLVYLDRWLNRKGLSLSGAPPALR